jgi:hypothetical protein
VLAARFEPLAIRAPGRDTVPPILTCLLSLVLAVVGATLVAAARERNEPSSGLVRATLVAAIPGVLLFAYMVYGFVLALVGGRGA